MLLNGGEVKMATSSIFANIEIKDPKAVRVFVDVLSSDKPWRFLEHGPHAMANG